MSKEVRGWRYYNHAAVPDCAPHEMPNLEPLKDGTIWQVGGGKALLARWTTDWDCGYETNWWHVIKDSEYRIDTLKAKRRYKITKCRKYFEVRKIHPEEYAEELFAVQVAAFSAYPASYRPTVEHDSFVEELKHWQDTVYGAFFRESGKLCGYTRIVFHVTYCESNVQKTIPQYEKYLVNAALLDGVLTDINGRLGKNFYITDGSRSIVHETNFQEYLEDLFGFRKAYCKLSIRYRPLLRGGVQILYPFRKLIAKINLKICKQITGVLRMEEIVRGQR